MSKKIIFLGKPSIQSANEHCEQNILPGIEEGYTPNPYYLLTSKKRENRTA